MESNTKHNNHSLTLELGFFTSSPNPKSPVVKPPPLVNDNHEPTLTLGLSTAVAEDAASSQSKRERESGGSSEDVEIITERGCNSRGSDEDEEEEEEEGSGPTTATTTITTTRKKLRLTKDQSALLEQSFKLHTSLNPKQKQALADRLNLRARQVEVWFQNRRARTKLKQTEVECEYLKKCFETLREENIRLQKEVDELKSMKVPPHHPPPPLYMQLPAATLTMCPSCERIAAGNNPPVPSNSPFPNKPHFFPSFPNPSSAAC